MGNMNMGSTSKQRSLDKRIQKIILKRYDQPVMNNTVRAHFVECLIAKEFDVGWKHSCIDGGEWNQWDCEHDSGARIEIKQSAARQSWDEEVISPIRLARYDIAPRTGYWENDDNWKDKPGRNADLYVFAWHGERRDEICDHRDATQWQFFIAKEPMLPEGQKTIGITPLKDISVVCGISDLRVTVEKLISEVTTHPPYLRKDEFLEL